MSFSTITSKGQLTVPKDVRDQIGLRTGDEVEFRVEKDGSARLLPMCVRPADVAGIFKHRVSRKVSVEEMDRRVEDAFRKGDV